MREYWWLQESKEVANHLNGLRRGWQQFGSNPVYQAWIRNIVSYNSTILEPTAWDSSIIYTGEQGEFVRMVVPQARSLVRQLVTLVTKQKLSFESLAQTNSIEIIKETRLANAVIKDKVVERQGLDKKGDTLTELAAIFGIAFAVPRWRTDKGNIISIGEQGILFDGEVDIAIKSPFDINLDANHEDYSNQDWVEIRWTENRWSLIAQFPELRDAILNLLPISKVAATWTYEDQAFKHDDLIFVYEAQHKATPALPEGRLVIYGDENTIFYDGPNIYYDKKADMSGIMPEPMIPENIFGMQFGHPFLSMLLPSQEMLDHSFSAIATNQAAFAVQNILAPRGSALNSQDIGGMNWISYTPQNVPGGGEPKALQLCSSSPETFKFIDLLKSHMLEISNLNSALRGSPPPGVTAGTAIATLTMNALEFLSSFSKSYNTVMEKVVKKAFFCYQKFTQSPHEVTVTGRNDISSVETFTGDSLQNIRQIKINVTNPLMSTLSGRSELADKLGQSGLIKNMQEYLSIIEGAPPQTLYEDELSENDCISQENEALLSGKPVSAVFTENHPLHVRKHAALLNNLDVKMQSDKTQMILDHVMQHVQLEQTTDPMIKAMTRTAQAPEMMMQPQMAPPPPPVEQQPEEQGPEALSSNPNVQRPEPAAGPAKPTEDLLGR